VDERRHWFLPEATTKWTPPHYQAFFWSHDRAKEEAVAELQKFAVKKMGIAESRHQQCGKSAPQAYTKLLSKILYELTFTYVDQLEEVED